MRPHWQRRGHQELDSGAGAFRYGPKGKNCSSGRIARAGYRTGAESYYSRRGEALDRKKDLARAEALLLQLADSDEYPFDAAERLLVAMGPEQSAGRMRIFGQALSNFEQHGSKNMI